MIVRTVRLTQLALFEKQLPDDRLPKVLFIGRSNVGKSSMINSLLQRRRVARTSSRPGKTLSANYFLVNDAFYFIDLPGYGFAQVNKREQQRVRSLLTGFLEKVKNVHLVCLLLDSRRGLLQSDLEMIGSLLEKKFPLLTILAKSDKLSFSSLKNQISEFTNKVGIYVIPFSIKSMLGQAEIWQQIDHALKER